LKGRTPNQGRRNRGNELRGGRQKRLAKGKGKKKRKDHRLGDQGNESMKPLRKEEGHPY